MKIYPEWIHSLHDATSPLRALLPGARYPLHGDTKFSPFFIIGSGRSGNTLLRRLLMRSRDIYIPPETYVLGRLVKQYRQCAYMRWPSLVKLTLSTIDYHPEFITFPVPSLRELGGELVTLPRAERNLATILDRFYRHCGKAVGREPIIWGDKTPLNTFSMRRIQKVFPDAKVIHMLRDGCDAAYSYVSAGLYETLDAAAERWAASVNTADAFVRRNPDVSLTIRYEDLVQAPEKVVPSIREFLGLETVLDANIYGDLERELGDVGLRAHHSRVTEPVDTTSIGKGRRSLSLSDKKLLATIIDKQLKYFSYPSCMS